MPFVTGQSGNPAGRPVGSRNKVNRAMDPVFAANGEAIIERVVEHAKAANPVAMRLCMDRLVPGGKHRLLRFQLPPMKTGEDVYAAITTIHDALGDGAISIGEAGERYTYKFGRRSTVIISDRRLRQRRRADDVRADAGPERRRARPTEDKPRFDLSRRAILGAKCRSHSTTAYTS